MLTGLVAAAAPLLGHSAFAQSTEAARPSTLATAASERTGESELAVIGPVLTPTGGGERGVIHRVIGSTEINGRPSGQDESLANRSREIESALRDAAQDLGLEVDLTATLPDDGAHELDLVQRAASGVWVISPRLEPAGGNAYLLRLVAGHPHSGTLLVRIERVEGKFAAARAVVMLRDEVTQRTSSGSGSALSAPSQPHAEEEAGRSQGRPVLAASTSLFGLFAALSIQRSAGSDDPRLLYPLLALGAGVGLGVSLLASEEWDVTPGDAWTLAGGTWWGVYAGLQLATAANVQPLDDRYAWGLGGGFIGTTLAVTTLATTKYDDGDAALTHSSAALGTLAGGAVELLARGDTDHSPNLGLGIGAAIGVVGGGLAGLFLETSAPRVLLVDLGIGVGALGGAAIASPLVFKPTSAAKTRLFLGGVLAGSAIGGTVAFFATRESRGSHGQKQPSSRLHPTAGVLAITPEQAPIYGAGVSGIF